jgi:energy-coupling factor transporter ATP-binding protein EcfA2
VAVIRVERAAAELGGALRAGPLSFAVEAGERVLVSGPSGSGKSTLLRLLSGALARRGARVTGLVELDGVDPASLPPAERPGRLAAVPQTPDDALVAGTVGDELSFGPRCAGRPADPAAAAARVGLRVPLDADPRRTSTGERQRCVVGAALAAGAPVLLLDEPLAHLDPAGAEALLATLAGLGSTVLLAEHRLRRARPWCTRELVLEGGLLVHDGPPLPLPAAPPAPALPAPGALLADPPLLPGLRRGERVALVGENGAGKTTRLRALADHLSRDAVYVPADPDLTLSMPTVRAELALGGGDPAALARALRVEHLLERSPHAASRGERLRVAVAAALGAGRPVLLLDEPTAGQDPDAVELLFAALAAVDRAVVFATHDLDVAARHAHRTLVVAR